MGQWSSRVWQSESDVMQNRSNRGSGKPVWVKAHQARAFDWDPTRRIALGPAVMETASTGRTHDCTRPTCINVKTTLAKWEPSTHDQSGHSTNENGGPKTAALLDAFSYIPLCSPSAPPHHSQSSQAEAEDGDRRQWGTSCSARVHHLACQFFCSNLSNLTVPIRPHPPIITPSWKDNELVQANRLFASHLSHCSPWARPARRRKGSN